MAYSSISAADLSGYLGVGEAEALELAREQPGWSVEGSMVCPAPRPEEARKQKPEEERLAQLTEYIAFLEK